MKQNTTTLQQMIRMATAGTLLGVAEEHSDQREHETAERHLHE
jgi:hypothetical protein